MPGLLVALAFTDTAPLSRHTVPNLRMLRYQPGYLYTEPCSPPKSESGSSSQAPADQSQEPTCLCGGHFQGTGAHTHRSFTVPVIRNSTKKECTQGGTQLLRGSHSLMPTFWAGTHLATAHPRSTTQGPVLQRVCCIGYSQ